jgi:phospholipid/cholesterol/gamma-HCH transport system substrate-binding protein
MAAFERQGREMLIGAAIIVALVAGALAIFFLEPFLGHFRHDDEIVAVLPEAPKLAAGADVWIGGKQVGRVTKVAFMPFHGDTMARIAATLEFPHDVHYLIRKDSHIRLTSARIIGAPVIDISPGSPQAPIIEHGDTLYMPVLTTLVGLDEKAVIIAAAMDSALKEVKKLAGPAKARMASLTPVMRNMSAAQTQLASLMDALQNGPVAQYMRGGKLMAEVASLQRTAAALGPAFSNARSNMSGASGTQIRSSLEHMQANAERLSTAIDRLQKLMQDNNGTAYRMTADSALLKTLQQARAQLDSLIIEAKKNPLKFVM